MKPLNWKYLNLLLCKIKQLLRIKNKTTYQLPYMTKMYHTTYMAIAGEDIKTGELVSYGEDGKMYRLRK